MVVNKVLGVLRDAVSRLKKNAEASCPLRLSFSAMECSMALLPHPATPFSQQIRSEPAPRAHSPRILSIVRRVPGKHVRFGSQDAPSAYGSIRDIFVTISSLSVTSQRFYCNVLTWFLICSDIIATNVDDFLIPEGIEDWPTDSDLATAGTD